MSEQINAVLKPQNDDGYTIKTISGCKIVYGPVPVGDLYGLVGFFGKDSVVAIDIAQRIGATLVIGSPENIEQLRALKLPISAERARDVSLARISNVPQAVVEWLADGNRGLSSEAICKQVFGIPLSAKTDHPRDPADFGRCLEFLAVIGAGYWMCYLKDQMRGVSPEWKRLIDNWDAIEACYRSEPERNNKPKTFALMDSVLRIERPEAKK